MSESQPKHQHFVPRVYLNKFAENKNGRFFLEGKKRDSTIPIPLSTKDICVKTDIYKLKNPKNGDPYYLEKFYAKHVDSVFADIYKTLINPNISTISTIDKEKIIYTITCFYFRTPIVLNALNKLTDELFDRSAQMTPGDTVKIGFEGSENTIEFDKKDIASIKKEHREENKQLHIETQFQTWHRFATYKMQAGLIVTKIEDDIELITSDNPVSIRSVIQNPFVLFDPSNIIHFSLDRKHVLTITPNSEDVQPSKIYRKNENKLYALMHNNTVQENCESWILGYPGTLDNHSTEQKIIIDELKNNPELEERVKLKSEMMNDLLQIMEIHGYPSQKVADKVKEMRKLGLFENELSDIILQLAGHGYLTV